MNKFDQVVSGAIDIAQSEALKRKNTELHAEHLLWGLLQNKSSYAHKALKDVASEIEALITRLPHSTQNISLDNLRPAAK
jgi:ATP-dependent Clp protease ATP-binding subunit ClpB